MVLEDAMTMSG